MSSNDGEQRAAKAIGQMIVGGLTALIFIWILPWLVGVLSHIVWNQFTDGWNW